MRKLSLAMMLGTLAVAAVFSDGPAARAADEGVSLKGQVVWAGEPKTPVTLKVDKDQGHCLAKGPLLAHIYDINKGNKGLKNVIVWLTKVDGTKPPVPASLAKPDKPSVEIDQPMCAFEPRVVAVREGQILVVKNSAPVAHNVSYIGSRAKNPGGNTIIAPGNKYDIKLKADKQQIALSCNIHQWMKGWARVFDHPYYAVTDADGKFEIKHAPKGEYMLVVWHEDGFNGGAAGAKGQKIKVDGTTEHKIEFKP